MDETHIDNEFLSVERASHRRRKKWTSNNEQVCRVKNRRRHLSFSKKIPVVADTTNRQVVDCLLENNVLHLMPSSSLVTRVETSNTSILSGEIHDNILYLRPNPTQIVDACSWANQIVGTSVVKNVLNIKPSASLVTNVVLENMNGYEAKIENNTLFLRKTDEKQW